MIDSGKGALAVARHLQSPDNEWIVLMDEAFFPYGNKSKEFLCKRAYYLSRILIAMKVDKIILACNTLSLMTLDFLRQNLDFDIVGIFDFIKDDLTADTLILGSQNTCKMVEKWGFPTLDGSRLIESIQKNRNIEECLKEMIPYFEPYRNVALACTHFLNIPFDKFGIDVIQPLEKLKEELKSKKPKTIGFRL